MPRKGPDPGGAGPHAGRPTIGDIAESLGLSKAAVSYALNGRPGVGVRTRERVLAAAEELGWHPSNSARVLRGADAGVVGLVLSRDPELLTFETFFVHFLAGLEKVLAERGSSLLLRVIGDHPDEEIATYRRWWGERRIDGVILLDERFRDPRVAQLAALRIPAVLCGGPLKDWTMPALWTDHAADAETAVEHLQALGHRRIAHIGGPMQFVHERSRRRGVRRAAARRGMQVVCVESGYTGPAAARHTHEVLGVDAGERPTAVVYGSDVMAANGLAAIDELGLDVPGDVSVLSWDDSQLATLIRPSVSALRRDNLAYGALAGGCLADLVQGHNRGAVQLPASTLEVRDSTGPARTAG
ncbi:MAG: LacI family DNA-binding transcriptional regulator [Nocardioidaceae bacterium]|nr:LacI family DNA-binding transcriptional regulator [Nocardioidaceae bacterium]NUS51189.1 LacI family DNA-binding transcriptional regulator [Nocardioidaceae bacterium]